MTPLLSPSGINYKKSVVFPKVTAIFVTVSIKLRLFRLGLGPCSSLFFDTHKKLLPESRNRDHGYFSTCVSTVVYKCYRYMFIGILFFYASWPIDIRGTMISISSFLSALNSD